MDFFCCLFWWRKYFAGRGKRKEGAGEGAGAGEKAGAGIGAGPGPLQKFDCPSADKELAARIETDILNYSPNICWSDVAGLLEAKELLQEAIILPRFWPRVFQGIRQPCKGVLMFGPPGTGKTMLAKAVATKCGTTFFKVSHSTLESKYVGDSERLVRILFEMARFYAPSTIFIDEIDSLCSRRGSNRESESSRKLKSQLLTEMDGICSNRDPRKVVIVIGATNLPWDLDEAMIRRLQKRIYIPLPDKNSREALLKLYLESVKLGSDVNLGHLAETLSGYSGADIENVCRDASMMSLRRKTNGLTIAQMEAMDQEEVVDLPVTLQDFYTAISKCNSSVSEENIHKYEQWMKNQGSS